MYARMPNHVFPRFKERNPTFGVLIINQTLSLVNINLSKYFFNKVLELLTVCHALSFD